MAEDIRDQVRQTTDWIEQQKFGDDTDPVWFTTETVWYRGGDFVVTIFTGPTDDTQRPFHAFYGEFSEDVDKITAWAESMTMIESSLDVYDERDNLFEDYSNVMHLGRGDFATGQRRAEARKVAGL